MIGKLCGKTMRLILIFCYESLILYFAIYCHSEDISIDDTFKSKYSYYLEYD